MRCGINSWIAVTGLACLLAAGPATRPGGAPQRVTFSESNPLSDLREWVHREGGTVEMLRRAGAVYDIKDESFEIYIPPDCRADNRHGLIVWIPPGRAEVPPEWLDVFDRTKLIWVAPNNAGNTRNALVRVALAMDAVHNVKKLYPIDEGRIYVAGFSGGGRAASIAAVGFPDVFTGGVCMMGCNFYRVVPAGPGTSYPVGSFRPPGRLFDEVKGHPLVLMTSDGDMNRPQTKAYYDAFRREGFKHVTYIEVPNLGHQMPETEWLEKTLAELDRTTVMTTRPVDSTVGSPKPATTRVATTQPERTDAERLLVKGKLYLDNGMTERGKETLQRLIELYPATKSAEEARSLLKR